MIALVLALLVATQPLAVTQVRDSYPSLSPDGRRLVFQSNRSGKQALWTSAADGSDPRPFFDGAALGADPSTPIWSPDGQRIAFAMRPAGATDENESEIYLMSSDGRAVTRLTNAPGDDSHPHWSADGRRIFFNSARATPDLKADWGRQWHDIYSMAPDGSAVLRHTDCKSVCTYPVPSPDGRFIAHRRTVDGPGLDWSLEPGARNSEVFVTGVEGSSSVNVSTSPSYDGWPMWSPDGRWVVFASNRDKQPDTGQIYAVRADGTELHRLTEGRLSRVQPSFTRDGTQILVYELTEGEGFEFGHVAKIPVTLNR